MANLRIDKEKLKAGIRNSDENSKLVSWPKGKNCKHPGDFFGRNFLSQTQGKSPENIAYRLGITLESYQAFLCGKLRIDENLAIHLQALTRFSRDTWMSLQVKFDETE